MALIYRLYQCFGVKTHCVSVIVPHGFEQVSLHASDPLFLEGGNNSWPTHFVRLLKEWGYFKLNVELLCQKEGFFIFTYSSFCYSDDTGLLPSLQQIL